MMRLSDWEVVDQFRNAIARQFGLAFDEGKRTFLGEVLAKRVERTESADAPTYVQRLLLGQLPRDELAALARECTVGETYFFRHPDQYRAFTAAALSAREAPRLRVLSAGCASGEEAYSLAILLREHIPDIANRDVRVVGIDLNADVLAKAVQARYTLWSLRGVSDDVRQRYFHVSDKEFRLDASTRTAVSFEERNLVDEAPDFWHPGAFDVIFCRNVLMYFTPEATRAIVGRFTRALTPDGLLFLGPAETLRGVSHDYHLRHSNDAFYYQRRSPDEVASPVVPAPAPLDPAAVCDSWVSAIGLASERIARLSREGRTPAPSERGDARGVNPAPGRTVPPGLLTAREMIRQERYADALSVLGLLTDTERHAPDAKLLRAVSLTNCGRVDEAEQLCHELLAGNDLYAEARYLLALCLEHTGNCGTAMEQDRTAIYLDPWFSMPHLHLGLLSKREGNREGARRAFGQALVLLPREDAARVLLFGGGFTRDALIRLCEAELRASEGNR